MPDTAIGTTPHATPSEVSSARELRVSRIAAAAGRDALDAGVDVLITTDAATIAYAAQRSDLGSVPLPWDRVYLLIEPASPARLVPDTARAFRGGLALDVARVDAQPVDPRQWGDMTEMCPVAASPSETAVGPRPSMAVPSRRIVYDRRDDVARALSERLVALADTRPVSTASRSAASELLRAAGLDSTELAGALATGLDAGYVLALPIRVSDFCRSTGAMLAEAPWLPLGDRTTADRIVPLVMTRPHAIVRAAWMGLSAEWLGDVFLEFGHPSSP
jgi:hypothetical protein